MLSLKFGRFAGALAALGAVALVVAPVQAAVISYGGFNYEDQSATTRLLTNRVPVGGVITVQSSTVRFHAGQQILVALEDVNRRPGSFGVTRLGLRSFRWTGGTLSVRGPDHPAYRGTYRVVVVTWEGGRPQHYMMPGTVTIN